ncbi:MAG: helix-turn-helix transcriptional regulator [Acidimicrobiales bacterium]
MSIAQSPQPDVPAWTFLTNHAHVLIAISRDPDARQKDIAWVVGITISRVQQIIGDLETGGYLRSERVGRRNRYHVIADRPLRHPLEDQHTVQDLIESLND